MSREAVLAIIRKSVIDRAFAKKLAKNTEAAISGYDLSAEELIAVKAMQIDFEQKFNGNGYHHAKKAHKKARV